MPQSVLVRAEEYRKSERGYLTSVAVSSFGITAALGVCYVVAGSMLGGRGDEFVCAVFFNDYVSTMGLGSWTGKYPLDPFEEIFLWVWADLGPSVRCVGKIETGDC